MKVVVAAFNQEKALVGAFYVLVQPIVEPMDRFAALVEAQVKEIGGDTNTGQRLTFDLLFYVILAVNTN